MPGFRHRRPSSRASERPGASASGQAGGADQGNAAVIEQMRAASGAPAEWAAVQSGQTLLRSGSRGDAVGHLQSILGIGADGIFGQDTAGAVRAYQRSKGLAADGVVGRGTAAVLAGGRAPTPEQEARDARDTARGGGQDAAPARGRADGAAPITVKPGQFARNGLRAEVLSVALDVFRAAWKRGDTVKTTYTVIDFSMPSTEKRMFVIDLAQGRLLFNELVTHGSGSGGNEMTSHSNREGSNQTSIGLARTAETYQSAKFGDRGLRMDGLERGYNDNMRRRAVVMHRADYATPEAIRSNGGERLGRSQGCPALDPRVSGKIIDTIKNGSLIFSYYPDPNYLARSKYVNG